MKRKLIVLMAIMMAVVTTAWAEVEVTVGCLTFKIDETNNCATLSKATNASIPSDGNVEIPATVESGGINYPVTKIGTKAFWQRTNLKSLTFASNSNLVEIEEEAIYDCGGLTTLVLPNGITTIGKLAFGYNSKLSSIELPASLLTVGEEAFSCCTALTSVVIPNNVTTINASAFYYCSNLEEVVLGSKVTTIGNSIFSFCNNLKYITSLNTTPPSVSSFGLQNTSQILSVKVPQGCKSAYVANSEWYDFRNVMTEIDPNAVLEYRLADGGAEVLFASTQNAQTYGGEIEVSSTAVIGGTTYPVVAVAANGFKGCKAIPTVKLPYTITRIGDNAFQGCEQLEKIYVTTASVPTLGVNALDGTAAGLTIAVRDGAYDSFSGTSGWGTSLAYVRLNEIAYTTVSGAAIEVKKNSWVGPKYIYSLNDNGQGAIVYEGVLTKFDFNTEDYGAFSGLSDLKTITLPASVTEISSRTFENCTGLTTVVLPENLTELLGNVFNGCTSLTTVTLPANLNSIYDSAFEGCSSLTSLTIPANVALIKNLAFRGCASLTELVMEPMTPCTIDGVGFKKNDNSYFEALRVKVHAGAEAAYKAAEKWNNATYFTINTYCHIKYTSKENVVIEPTETGENPWGNGAKKVYNYIHDGYGYIEFDKEITQIGYNAFMGRTALTSIVIPESVTKICDQAFCNCYFMALNHLPDGLTEIGSRAFESCSTISVTLPTSLTTIGMSAFSSCSGVVGAVNLSNVESLGTSAFLNSYRITSVTLPASMTTIPYQAFSGCYGIESVSMPGVTKICSLAFNGCKALTTVQLPAGVTEIEANAFGQNNYVTKVEFGGSLADWCGITFGNADANPMKRDGHITTLADLYVTENGELTKVAELVIPTTEVKNYAFVNSSIESLDLTGVTAIGASAFSGCSSLAAISVGETPATLGSDAFSGISTSHAVNVPVANYMAYMRADGWKELNFNPLAGEIELVDNGENEYIIDQTVAGCEISYTRTFINDKWNALYLPFALEYSEWEQYGDVAKLNNVHQYDTDGDGVLDYTTIEFNRVTSDAITPNTPYVFKAKTAEEVTFQHEGTLCGAPAKDGSVDCSTTEQVYTLYGNYETKSGLYDAGAYALSANGVFAKALTENQKLKPFRIYLIITDKTSGYNPAPNQAPMRVGITVDGEPTGIDEIEILRHHDGTYYDLSGRRIAEPAHGIFIQNGKKVFIKK